MADPTQHVIWVQTRLGRLGPESRRRRFSACPERFVAVTVRNPCMLVQGSMFSPKRVMLFFHGFTPLHTRHVAVHEAATHGYATNLIVSKKPFYVYSRILHAYTIIYLKYRVYCSLRAQRSAPSSFYLFSDPLLEDKILKSHVLPCSGPERPSAGTPLRHFVGTRLGSK